MIGSDRERNLNLEKMCGIRRERFIVKQSERNEKVSKKKGIKQNR